MADQSVSNERKKELEQIDPFQEALLKGAGYAAKNKKQLLLIAGAVLVVCITFSTIMLNLKKSEHTASRMVAAAVEQYIKSMSGDQGSLKGYEAVKDQFQAVFDEYPNTSAGKMAKIKFAKICYDAGKYERADELYEEALDIFGNAAGMENFLLAALGNIAQTQNNPEKAKSYYLRIETGESSLLKDEARFALAILYEAAGDHESSLKMYEKIINGDGESMYRAMAEARATGI